MTRNGAGEYYGVDGADRLLWTNTAANAAPTAGQSQPYNLFGYDAFGNMVRRERKSNATDPARVLDFAWDTDGLLEG